MELTNFGAVLTFAAETEAADSAFYAAIREMASLENYGNTFEAVGTALKKNEKDLLRARRENVTEMILEHIHDFDSESFVPDRSVTDNMTAEAAVNRAITIEDKAVEFYIVAAEKLRGLPEVSRILKRVGKIRSANREKLKDLIR